ncbi:MAG: TGS domain-containing protein, partial [Clostridia bacterium]|nr:TGS domain-containing protein [Clostridia bacterium]
MKIKINGENYSVGEGLSAFDAAREAGIELSRDIIAAEINGKTSDLTTKVSDGDEVRLLTFEDEGGAHTFRHTASHVLAAAVKRLYPNTKLTIGPAIENGFYYDFDSDTTFTPDVLEKIEAEMKKVVKENAKLERYTLPRAEALEFMKDEPYKVELINDLPEDAEISFYKMGDFTDLCAGPHLFSTGAIKAFKLTACNSAYWRGDSKNKVLQRIYGTAFPKKEDLDEYIQKLEEAKLRDHRKIGKDLGLFMT